MRYKFFAYEANAYKIENYAIIKTTYRGVACARDEKRAKPLIINYYKNFDYMTVEISWIKKAPKYIPYIVCDGYQGTIIEMSPPKGYSNDIAIIN